MSHKYTNVEPSLAICTHHMQLRTHMQNRLNQVLFFSLLR